MASRAAGPPARFGSSSRKPSSVTRCRNATTSGCGRITSATSRSARPISELTLWGTDCDSVSAAFFSPSHSSSWSFSHHAASMADMNTWWLRGSKRIRSQLLDVLQDEVEQRRSGQRFDVALQRGDRRLAVRDEVGDDGGIDLDRGGRAGARRRRGGRRVGKRPDEVAAIDDGLQRVADERIRLPETADEAVADRRRRQRLGDVDEETAARLGHRSRRRHLPEREPEGLHGVGHHLLVTDGHVDVVLSVVGRRDGEQRGDRPALHELEPVVGEAPLDVLGATEVRFDPTAERRELHDLRIA